MSRSCKSHDRDYKSVSRLLPPHPRPRIKIFPPEPKRRCALELGESFALQWAVGGEASEADPGRASFGVGEGEVVCLGKSEGLAVEDAAEDGAGSCVLVED